MVQITKIVWQAERIAHIQGKHQVTPEEVEEVCWENPIILRGRGKRKEKGRVYQVMGQTYAGRYLFVIVRYLGEGRARGITARDMDYAERKWYMRRR